jgi:nucleoside-diphosphate-sugar epimerase
VRVLVTGAAGRIGRPVVRAFREAGHEVVAFDRVAWTHGAGADGPARRAGLPAVRAVVGDHEDLGQVIQAARGCEAVAHLSAIPSPGGVPDAVLFRANVMGTYNVHAAAAALGIGTVVSTSSQSAFGWAWGRRDRDWLPRHLPLDEGHPDEPDDDYGLSKVVGEQVAACFHRKTGMRTIVLRPPYVRMPGEDVRGAVEHPRWRAALFSYLDVRDLAEAFRCAVERTELRHEVLNVCADDALAAEPLCDLLPRLDPRFRDLAAPLTGTRPMVDNGRAKRLLRWQPVHSWREAAEPAG